MRARILRFHLLAAVALASSVPGRLPAAVPGSQAHTDAKEAPRIVQLESLRGVSSADQKAIFEEYVLAYRAAALAHQQARQRELADNAVRLFPQYRRPWCHQAAARIELQQWGPAIESARRAEKAKDDAFAPAPLPGEGFAGAAYWEGWALYRTQRYAEALPRLRAARERAPEWAEGARGLGEAAFVAGKMKDAAAAYDAAFALDATIGSAHDLAYWAEARSASGDLDGGIAALQEALRRSPNEPGLHAKLGDLLRREGQLVDAYYELVLEGVLHGVGGRFAQPAVNMAQAIVDSSRAHPNHQDSHELSVVSRSLANLDAGHPHGAIHDLQHLLRTTRSASPVPRLLLADALYRDQQPTPARAVLEELLETRPDFVPALYLLSDVQTKLGFPREAEAALQRARTLFPGYWKLHTSTRRS